MLQKHQKIRGHERGKKVAIIWIRTTLDRPWLKESCHYLVTIQYGQYWIDQLNIGRSFEMRSSRFLRSANLLCVDSQTDLKSISSYETESLLVKECNLTLTKLGNLQCVLLCWVPCWVPRHIEGNNKADLLARQGSSMHISWKEYYVPLHQQSSGLRNTSLSNGV